MTPHPQPKEFYQIDRMVNAFSRIMKMKLHENMHKGSWEKCTFDYLRSRIDDEIKEFDKAIEEGRYSDAMIEGGDVGNFFAMIGDNIEFGRFKNYTRSRPAPAALDPEINPNEADARGYRCPHCEVRNDVRFCHYVGKVVAYSPQPPAPDALKQFLAELESIVARSTPDKGTLYEGWLLVYPIDRWISYQKKQLRQSQQGGDRR